MKRVLVVDDRPINREFLVTLLGYGGYEVLQVDGGEAALDVLEAGPVDLVISDILMPDVDGYELVRRIAARPHLAALPVIFYSAAFLDPAAERFARACGVTRLLSKPTDPERILAVVQEALAAQSPPGPRADEDTYRGELRALGEGLARRVEVVVPRLTQLIAIGQALAVERNAGRLLELACAEGRRLVGARSAAVVLFDGSGTVSGCVSDAEKGAGGLGRPVAGAPLWSEARGPGRVSAAAAAGAFEPAPATGLLLAPLAGAGWLVFSDPVDPAGFDADVEELAATLAAQLGVAYSNARHAEELESEIAVRRAVEVELRAAREEALAATRAKSEFLASMSHELRTPLNAIIGFSELMSDGSAGPLTAKQERYVGNVLASGRHLLRLVNDVLDLAKIEAGRLELNPSAVNPGEIVNSVAGIVHGLAEAAGIELDVDAPVTSRRIVADEAKIKQVLYNLAGNAIKFTPRGGNVRVAARFEKDVLRLTVTDTGIGLAPDDLERIFLPFEQANGSTAREFGGTGLGLALSKRLVELHGGTVWAESGGQGRGATFGVELPVVEARPESAGGSPAPAGPPEGPAVLVVEDDPVVASLIGIYLVDEGYSVHYAATAEEALAAARSLRPAAITLDLILQGADGWSVLAELKADARTACIPVVVVTVLEDRERGIDLGAIDFLVKPVSRDRLVASLAAVCPNPASFSVLVVDDDRSVVEQIGYLLRSRGWTVTPAFSGRDAIDIAVACPPDAVILDLHMPGIDGYEVARTLRARTETAAVPILVYTSADLSRADRARLEPSISAICFKADTGVRELVGRVRRMTAAACPS